ncbi:hypothetical protein [Streptomyces xiamenensis]|uniref:hypothetical protein n=1 Tax=Streptomyces xiamenensis TaxID=408015 RepID=UPI003D71BE6B
MRKTIRRLRPAIEHLLESLFPATGRRRAEQLGNAHRGGQGHWQSEPTPVDPWSLPWRSPSKEEAAEIFARQAAAAEEAKRTRDRRRAAVLADMGQDYPYTYEGAPFGPDAFREGVAA